MSKQATEQRPIQEAAGKLMRKFFFEQMLLPKNLAQLEADPENGDFFAPKKPNETTQDRTIEQQAAALAMTVADFKQAQQMQHQQDQTNPGSVDGGIFIAKKYTEWHAALSTFKQNSTIENARQFFEILKRHTDGEAEYWVNYAAFPYVANVFNAELYIDSAIQTTTIQPNMGSQPIGKLYTVHNGAHFGGDKTLDNGDCFFISLLENHGSFSAIMAAVKNANMPDADQEALLAAHNVYRQLNDLPALPMANVNLQLAPADAADAPTPPPPASPAPEQAAAQAFSSSAIVGSPPTPVAINAGESKLDAHQTRRRKEEAAAYFNQICEEFSTHTKSSDKSTTEDTPRARASSSDSQGSSDSQKSIIHFVDSPQPPAHRFFNDEPSSRSAAVVISGAAQSEDQAIDSDNDRQIIIYRTSRNGKQTPTKVTAPGGVITADTATAMIAYLASKGIQTVTISDKYDATAQGILRTAINATQGITEQIQADTREESLPFN